MAERSEAKSAKRSFASNFKIQNIFDAKLRFALFTSLRSAIFSENPSEQLIGHFPHKG